MSKKIVILLSVMVLSMALSAQQTDVGEWWNDLSVSHVNKVPPRANVIPYSDENGVDRLSYRESDYYRCLNGDWSFFYGNSPADKPEGFYERDYDCESWGFMPVPGNWELNGYGQPVYVNVANEFKSNPPYAPTDYNPVGCYRTSFQVPSEWYGRNVYINFGAAKSCMFLWINGDFVGYSEDSKTPAEFDITDYVDFGEDVKNTLAVEMYRFCDGSYLEAQDFWRMSGITRDVILYSKPKLNVFDFFVNAGLDSRYEKGTFGIGIDIAFDAKQIPSKFYVEVEINGIGKDRKDFEKVFVNELKKKHLKKCRETGLYHLDIEETVLPDVLPWSAEKPNLYNLIIRIKDKEGVVVETVGAKIGFRTTEIKDGLLKVNGQAIMVKGVNRHEHSGTTGQYVPRKIMEQDVQIMLENNINTVRTCHYPDDIYWYELCDKYGIYVIDEANNESHPQGYGANSLAKKDEWKESFLYRCRNMLERDKNHASIIVWSVGNECGNGVCTKACYDWMKERDTRPVICERAIYDYNTDFIGLMYSDVDYLERFVNERFDSLNRPFIMVEYCHAMGNSCGGLQDYMEVFEKYPQLQGGCIWDFVDQSIVMYDNEFKKQWYAAGGDLGEIPNCGNDDSFCVNGLITSDRIPHNHMLEVRKAYQNVSVLATDITEGVFEIYNKFNFTNLKELECSYSIYSNERQFQKSKLNLDCAPGQSVTVKIPIPCASVVDGVVTGTPNVEYFIDFSFVKDAREVAYEQLKLDIPSAKPVDVSDAPRVDFKQTNDAIVVSNKSFSFTIDKNDGVPTSFKYGDNEILEGAIRPNFWRAPTLNDDVDGNARKKWEAAGLNNLRVSDNKHFDVRRIDAGHVAVAVELELVNYNDDLVIRTGQTYVIDGFGNVVVTLNVQPTALVETFPKIGTQMRIPLQYHRVSYFGKDTENYPDRNAAGRVGVYTVDANALFEMHEEPQESGNRNDVRWFALTDRDGNGIFVSGKENLNFSMYQYSDEDLTKAERINQIKPASFWTVNIDNRQAPLGTATCGPDALDKYLIKNNMYEYTFRIRPFSNKETNAKKLYQENVFDISKQCPVPQISSSLEKFNSPMEISLAAEGLDNVSIYYTLDGSEPTRKSNLYNTPFTINNSVTLKAKAFSADAAPSFTMTKKFEKIIISGTTFPTGPARNYSKDKDIALMDKKFGTVGVWDNNWLGFQGYDMDALIELSEAVDMEKIYVGFAISPDSWVLSPKEIVVSTSSDGVTFSEPVVAEMPVFSGNIDVRADARAKVFAKDVKYIRVIVKNFGVLPEKHPYKGEKAWIMVDEVRYE
ncbi:MAG: glycoside hydrolase family 2 TIM barrel-domain containing protein [Candidatus Limimorpha sp.]